MDTLLDISTLNTTPQVNIESSSDSSVWELGSSLFDNIGGFQGLGDALGIIGNIWGGMEQRKYQKDMLNTEKARIKRAQDRQDKFDKGMSDAWK